MLCLSGFVLHFHWAPLYSGLRSPGRSKSTYFWNDSWVQTFHNQITIRFGFCGIRINQGLGKCYQPRAWLTSTLIIPDVIETSSNISPVSNSSRPLRRSTENSFTQGKPRPKVKYSQIPSKGCLDLSLKQQTQMYAGLLLTGICE